MVRLLLWFSLLFPVALAQAAGPELARARDLGADAAAARERRVPLLLMFHADHCGWCLRMEEEFLKPMLRSGDYEEKVTMRKVKLDAGFRLTGIDGRSTTGAQLAKRYRVTFTPTLLLLDGDGNELERLVGLTTPDYFGGYLDGAIDSALRQVRGAEAAGAPPAPEGG